MICPIKKIVRSQEIPPPTEISQGNSDWARSCMNTLNAGVFSYPHFEQDKVVATELFDEGDFDGFEHLLRHIHSKQRFYEGDRSHFLHFAMYNADFNYPGWPDDLDSIKELFLFSVNAFAENDTRRLLRAMTNKQRLHDDIDLHPGIITLRSSIFSYEGFQEDKRDAMNAYRSGYESVFEKCFDKILTKQKIYDANIDVHDVDSESTQVEPPGFSMTGEEDELHSSGTLRPSTDNEISYQGSVRNELAPFRVFHLPRICH